MNNTSEFKNALISMIREPSTSRMGDSQTKAFFDALLKFGSATPDNTNCTKNLDFGKVSEPHCARGPVVGFKVKGKSILVSDIAAAVESMEMPSEVRNEFPDLSESEWDAAMRLIVLILSGMER